MSLSDYPKDKLEKIVQESKNVNDVLRKLGYSAYSGRNHWTIQRRIAELNISTTHFTSIKGKKRTDEELFVENSDAANTVVRRRFKKGRYAPYVCDICGQSADWNGKPLTLILDHRNGDNTDNRLDNLHWVCPNCNSQLGTTGFHGIRKYDSLGNKLDEETYIKLDRHNYCVKCGCEISLKAIYCKKCFQKHMIRPIDALPVTRNELKRKIREMPFVLIGREYGVTDNTIRKWCKKFGLPYKSSIIKLYSDEEWEKI